MDAQRARKAALQFCKRPGMYTLGGSFAECCAYLQGLDAGADGSLLGGFADWIRSVHPLRPELAWQGLVLELSTGTASSSDLSEEQSAAARQTLFDLLEQFFADGGHAVIRGMASDA